VSILGDGSGNIHDGSAEPKSPTADGYRCRNRNQTNGKDSGSSSRGTGEEIMSIITGDDLAAIFEIAEVGAERSAEYIKHQLSMSDEEFDRLINLCVVFNEKEERS
jgi:hypothetical protein